MRPLPHQTYIYYEEEGSMKQDCRQEGEGRDTTWARRTRTQAKAREKGEGKRADWGCMWAQNQRTPATLCSTGIRTNPCVLFTQKHLSAPFCVPSLAHVGQAEGSLCWCDSSRLEGTPQHLHPRGSGTTKSSHLRSQGSRWTYRCPTLL